MLDYHYYTFIKVYETLSFTKASKELNITQPAVSNHISYLEKKLKTKLFTYKKKKLNITESADYLYEKIIFLANFSEDTIRQLGTLDSHNIKLGYTPLINNQFISDVIELAVKEDKKLNLDITVDSAVNLLAKLSKGIIDIAFIHGNIDKNLFSSIHLYTDQLVGIRSLTTESSSKRVVEDMPIIIEKEQIVQKKFRLIPYKRHIFVDNDSLIKQLVANDIGVSYLMKSTVQKELNKKELTTFKFSEQLPTVTISFVYVCNTEAVDLFLSILDKVKNKSE